MIGPLVVSTVSVSKGKESKFSKIGVRDSKLLTSRKRLFLYDEIYSIAEEVKVYKIDPLEINEAMRNKISINELEALNFARLIDSLVVVPSKIFLDSPDVISERFGTRVGFFCKSARLISSGTRRPKDDKSSAQSIQVVSEHKADARYPVVSAASIIAKVVRDKEIERISDKTGIEIGSGYPSDRYTVDAIRKHLGTNHLEPYLRSYWQTLKNIRQLKIEEFLIK